ncbi:MAG: RHS repeat protein, partial [Phycisphaerae bacterium]|nr:RHS repeat protein [Phycisphaerae bacterium]
MNKWAPITVTSALCMILATNAVSAITYEYDDLGQLTRVINDDGSAILYEYDAVGNRTRLATCSVADAVYLAVYVDPPGSGSVTLEPDLPLYSPGTPITLTPVPHGICELVEWSGDVPTGHEHDNPLTITADQCIMRITAHFTSSWGDMRDDCNTNGIPDGCEGGDDCNANGILDECEPDCNANGIPDDCDISFGTSDDCDENGKPDECEWADCNNNDALDACDIIEGTSLDCNENDVPDECDISGGTSTDLDGNGVPDECDDCNMNGIMDRCDISCDGLCASIPECGLIADCQPDNIPDDCQLLGELEYAYRLDDGTHETALGLSGGGSVAWINRFIVEDGYETIGAIRLAWGGVADGTPTTVYLWNDPNGDGNPTDAQVLASAETVSANGNTNLFTTVYIAETYVGPVGTSFFAGAIAYHLDGEHPASLDMSTSAGQSWLAGDSAPLDPNNLGAANLGPSTVDSLGAPGNWLLRVKAFGTNDCNDNGIPDDCEPDCNGNGVADECDITAGTSHDCQPNGIPDECEPDCNANGIADECDITAGTSDDCNADTVPDECEISAGTGSDCNTNSVLDECDIDIGTSDDCNANGNPDECDVERCYNLWDGFSEFASNTPMHGFDGVPYPDGGDGSIWINPNGNAKIDRRGCESGSLADRAVQVSVPGGTGTPDDWYVISEYLQPYYGVLPPRERIHSLTFRAKVGLNLDPGTDWQFSLVDATNTEKVIIIQFSSTASWILPGSIAVENPPGQYIDTGVTIELNTCYDIGITLDNNSGTVAVYIDDELKVLTPLATNARRVDYFRVDTVGNGSGSTSSATFKLDYFDQCLTGGLVVPPSQFPDCNGNGTLDECDLADCAGDPACDDCNLN